VRGVFALPAIDFDRQPVYKAAAVKHLTDVVTKLLGGRGQTGAARPALGSRSPRQPLLPQDPPATAEKRERTPCARDPGVCGRVASRAPRRAGTAPPSPAHGRSHADPRQTNAAVRALGIRAQLDWSQADRRSPTSLRHSGASVLVRGGRAQLDGSLADRHSWTDPGETGAAEQVLGGWAQLNWYRAVGRVPVGLRARPQFPLHVHLAAQGTRNPCCHLDVVSPRTRGSSRSASQARAACRIPRDSRGFGQRLRLGPARLP
jgi:hypothetical protein